MIDSPNSEPDELDAGKMDEGRESTAEEPALAELKPARQEGGASELGIQVDGKALEEADTEPGEASASAVDRAETGCPIGMGTFGDRRCGRELHAAVWGTDEQQVCLMHSKDFAKQQGALFDSFCLEFERILSAAGANVASFERFVFPQLDFRERKFQAVCRLGFATFTRDADFRGAIFAQEADFGEATFSQGAMFEGATFTRKANFVGAAFVQGADFHGVNFKEEADFRKAVLSQGGSFANAIFAKGANFWRTTFTQAADFADAEFHGTVNWTRSQFLDRAEFRRTKFDPLADGQPCAVFSMAGFLEPAEVVFDDVDLSRALFRNLDVSEVWFTSSVRWGRQTGGAGYKVFEEIIDLKHEFGAELERNGQRDYRAVEQIYQQLKKNYDSRLDYRTANEFHYSEMEMKRLTAPPNGRLFGLRRWRQNSLSLVALYRYASDYGNSYVKPVLWLLATIVVAASLFPIPGLEARQQGPRPAETYSSMWNTQDTWSNNLWTESKLLGTGTIAAVDSATFQRNPEYVPAYPWGRVVAILETLLTSTLLGLFLLAIRRQFRR